MGTGGSRYGAGRPGWRLKAEHTRALDVRRFAAENMLGFGAWTWQWRDPDSGAVKSSIGVYGGPDSLRLDFQVEGVPAQQVVPVVRTACHFGGSRPWFLCPCCRQRAGKLFLRWRRFACRLCQQVSYSSQSEDDMGRAWRAQHKLEAKLGENWRRPKGMRCATYERLLDRINAAEEARDLALVAFMQRFRGLNWR